MDMTRAFDRVNHKALIHKLQTCFHVSGNLLSWFRSYVEGRRQRVTVLGATSADKPVTSGVPQGSILGPILFLLYVNDLPDVVQHSNIACFADDTKLYKCIDSNPDASLLQRDLTNLGNWSASSGLTFNEDKCKCQRITRKVKPVEHSYQLAGKPLEVTTAEKDLGVWISSDLTWTRHVTEKCAKANKLLGFLRRCALEISNHRTRRTLYLAVVRPVLGYATQVWCPQTVELIRRTERIQRRATKFILDLPFLCSETYKDRLVATNLLPICYWHEFMDLTLFFKATTGMISISPNVIPQKLIPSRITRSTANPNVTSFRIRKCKTVTYQNSFFNRTARIWNILPECIRMPTSIQSFKLKLLEYYFEALRTSYDPEEPRTWKSICVKCKNARLLNCPVTCCF